MHDFPEIRRLRLVVGTVALALALAILVVGRVTMRSVPLDWDVPGYGFPLQAYGWTGWSSGEWWFAVVPLLVDTGVALLLTLPFSYVVLSRMRSSWALIVGLAGLLVALARHTLVLLGLLMGIHHIRLLGDRDWPVECRSLWIGPPDAALDWNDEHDTCVIRARARLEASKE